MRLDFIACKYTHFIQYGKTIEYFFAKRIRNFAEIKRISTPMAHIKQLQKNREFMKQMKRFILQVQCFSLNLYFEQKKQKKHGKTTAISLCAQRLRTLP